MRIRLRNDRNGFFFSFHGFSVHSIDREAVNCQLCLTKRKRDEREAEYKCVHTLIGVRTMHLEASEEKANVR